MLDDDGKLARKLLNKQVNARKENIDCFLSLSDIEFLLKEADIRSSDWGFASGKNYVLARYGDVGPYSIENCRFISQKENMQEQITSEKQRAAARINCYKGLESFKTPEAIESRNKALAIRYEQFRIEREEKIANMHQSFVGEKNSQFGSYWINNGSQNKKWKDEKGSIPAGFSKGRIGVIQVWNK